MKIYYSVVYAKHCTRYQNSPTCTPRLKFQVARLQANVAVSVNDKSERQARCSGSDVDIYCAEISGSHHVPYHYVCKSSPIISLDLSLTKLVFPLRKTALASSISAVCIMLADVVA
jgi:hypothetical protein